MMQKITPFLWFDTQAEEAAEYYVGIFPDSKINEVARYSVDAPGGPTVGSVMTVSFQVAGQEFTALNGGQQGFAFNESISFFVNCADQEEVDELWAKLTADGGEPGPCGWLKDRYGVSWQIVPTELPQLLSDPDTAKAQRVMAAMMKMQKIDVQALRDAAAG
jgi:predicted 3-demethylubiquinone-9 3-methyltransferase (glyoxalase superfamily)